MATSTVPSPREIELADYKLGSFFSDLDVMETTIEKLARPWTIEEYLAFDESEREAKVASVPDPTVEELTPLLIFAIELEGDAQRLAERAAKLRESAMTLIHQARDGDIRDKNTWGEYRARVAAWHAEAAAHYGDES